MVAAVNADELHALGDSVAALRAVARILAQAHAMTAEALAVGDTVLTQAERLLANAGAAS